MTRGSRQRLAWLALLWERLWPALWPAIGIVLAFAVAVAFDVLPGLPPWLHGLVLAAVAAGLVLALRSAARTFRLPLPEQARRRLELDSGLEHRPLDAIRDRLAVAEHDAFARALWEAHRWRMAQAARRLKLAWPRAGLVHADPYGLRVLLTLLLGIGLIASGGDFSRHLARALHPAFGAAGPVASVGFDLWITPPDYTGLPPIYRGTAVAEAPDAADRPIPVPVGSTVLARVHGGNATPELALDGKPTPFGTVAGGEFNVSAPIGEAGGIAIRQDGATLARYVLQIVPDQPPAARWTEPAKIMARGTLRLDYEATDDYGVKSLTLEVKRATGDEPPVEIPVAAPAQAKEVKSAIFEDLTPSPWAGLPVELTLIARDALGQVGRSAPQVLKLPERQFHNPVAKAVVEQRTLLRRDPSQSDIVSETLSDLALQSPLYHDDAAVFLGLRAASRRLGLDHSLGADPGTQQLLWDIAVRIEDGDVPEAQKSLREAQQALQDALDRNASDAELERLMAQLNQAIQRYLQALTAQSSQDQQPGNGPSVSAEDIQKRLDELRRLAQTGARDAARQALAELQNLLESLRNGQKRQAQGGSGGSPLRDLAHKQEQLLDRSYDAARQKREQGQEGGAQPQGQRKPGEGKPGDAKPGEAPGDLATRQEQLRKQLGEMMRQLGQQGDVPQALGRAERWMKSAEDALKRGQPGDAVGSEGEALDQLQQGARELAERNGQGEGETGGRQATGADPFGRNNSGDIDDGNVKLPAAVDLQRSREILDELRRRAGQPDRPRLERDYLNRLLQRF